jgi:hypothetical protein
MLLRFALMDSVLAAASAKVFAVENISACRWGTVLTPPTVRRLFKWLG